MDIPTILVFVVTLVANPQTDKTPEISDRIFKNKEECATFVNTLAEQTVVREDGLFKFATVDGYLFVGGCMTEEEYDKYTVPKISV